jgi:hypothetical protein
MKKLLFLVSMCAYFSSFGQLTLYRIDSGGLIKTCNGVFTDDGGSWQNYQPGQREIISFQPPDSSLFHLRFTFDQLDVNATDTLFVYEGKDTLSP